MLVHLSITWLLGGKYNISKYTESDSNSPTLVANLWDVTDGDIDKFSQAVLDKWQMTAERVRGWERESSQSKGTSLVAAVAQSRDACKLKYLTGAAPVVYGIPLYL